MAKARQTPEIIYIDDDLLVVHKPAQMPVQADKSGDIDLETYIRQYIAETYNQSSYEEVQLVHRIDRPVSGLVLMARTQRIADVLLEMMKNQQIEKHYIALVKGALPKNNGELSNFILKDAVKQTAFIYTWLKPGAKTAELKYHVIKKDKEKSLIKINLKTGRFHQIRAQFAHINHPVIGDTKYGDYKQKSKFIYLASYSFSFRHPNSGKQVNVELYPDWYDLDLNHYHI
jgi:23S rRNA pseudouridine1911/1915/1917 synthase